MLKWQDYLAKKDFFFVSPDLKRGLGLEDVLPNYHLICSYYDPLIPILRKQGARIFCLEEEGEEVRQLNNTGKLLERKKVQAYLRKNSSGSPRIVFFKPSAKIDFILKKYGYQKIGNKAELNNLFENKINFFQFLKRKALLHFLPPGEIDFLGKMDFLSLAKRYTLPFVIQFGYGWAGKTTFFIESEKEFISLKKKFPQTKVKVSKNIKGFTVLNNAAIYAGKVYLSPPALQLSGIRELSVKKSVTCGRQWPVKFLTKEQERIIRKISLIIGTLMGNKGFQGFFGLDFLIEEKTGKVYLSENNARLTASVPFYTKLELAENFIPLIVFHLLSFSQKTSFSLSYPENFSLLGSQIIFREGSLLPNLETKFKYGVFALKEGRPQLKERTYFPGRLSPKEFIFWRSPKELLKEEVARIECKREVLEKVGQLKKWIRKILLPPFTEETRL